MALCAQGTCLRTPGMQLCLSCRWIWVCMLVGKNSFQAFVCACASWDEVPYKVLCFPIARAVRLMGHPSTTE